MIITDSLGRCWTISTERAVEGFRWTIYCHPQSVLETALDEGRGE